MDGGTGLIKKNGIAGNTMKTLIRQHIGPDIGTVSRYMKVKTKSRV